NRLSILVRAGLRGLPRLRGLRVWKRLVSRPRHLTQVLILDRRPVVILLRVIRPACEHLRDVAIRGLSAAITTIGTVDAPRRSGHIPFAREVAGHGARPCFLIISRVWAELVIKPPQLVHAADEILYGVIS